MSPDRQALLSLYHDDATALLDRALQAQHEPEGLHLVHAALVEALADAHTDGREPSVSTTVPDETAALRAQVEHLTDLVRHARGPLHEDGLLTDAEYAALAEDSGAVVRLTTIAQLQGDVARETRAKNVAIGERTVTRVNAAGTGAIRAFAVQSRYRVERGAPMHPWGVLDLCDAWAAEGARVVLLRDGREVTE